MNLRECILHLNDDELLMYEINDLDEFVYDFLNIENLFEVLTDLTYDTFEVLLNVIGYKKIEIKDDYSIHLERLKAFIPIFNDEVPEDVKNVLLKNLNGDLINERNIISNIKIVNAYAINYISKIKKDDFIKLVNKLGRVKLTNLDNYQIYLDCEYDGDYLIYKNNDLISFYTPEKEELIKSYEQDVIVTNNSFEQFIIKNKLPISLYYDVIDKIKDYYNPSIINQYIIDNYNIDLLDMINEVYKFVRIKKLNGFTTLEYEKII